MSRAYKIQNPEGIYFLSFAIRTIPIGIAYAIWSGVGIVLITIIGAIFFKQIPDLPAIIGLALILIGVLVINIFSKTMETETRQYKIVACVI